MRFVLDQVVMATTVSRVPPEDDAANVSGIRAWCAALEYLENAATLHVRSANILATADPMAVVHKIE